MSSSSVEDGFLDGIPKHDIAFITIYGLFILLITVTNLTVFITFHSMKKPMKEKIPNVLLINQAAVDFLIGLALVPRLIFMSRVAQNETFDIYKFFSEWSIFLAVLTLMVGTLERYFCFKYPMKHHRYATINKTMITLVCVWIISTIPSFVHIFYIGDKHVAVWKYFVGAAVVLLFGVGIVFILLYLTYREIRKSIDSKINSAQLSSNDATNRAATNVVVAEEKKKAKVTKVFLRMAIVYTVTILPLIIGQIVLDLAHVDQKLVLLVKNILYIFYLCSSVVNPILTLICKPDFTKRLKELFKKGDTGRPKDRQVNENGTNGDISKQNIATTSA